MAGHSETQQNQEASIPPELRPLMRGAAGAGVDALNVGLPSLLQSMQTPFVQRIPGLDPLEQLAGQQIGSQLGEAPGLRQAGIGQLAQLTGGEVGQSPATQQAIKALRAPLRREFETQFLPGLQSQMSLAGLGRSGALGSQMVQAEEQFQERFQKGITPFLQEEVAMRERAVPQYLNLAQQGMQQGLGFGGMERGIEEAKGVAELADVQNRQQLAEQAVFGPVQTLLPSSIGQNVRTTQRAPFMLGGTK
jgi:hypothetical protein